MKKVMAVLLSTLLMMTLVFPFGPIEANAATTKITDMNTTNGKYKAASWAVDNGYMQLNNGKFQSELLVSELQLLQMIAKLDRNFNFNSTNPDTLYGYYGELNLPLYGVTNKTKRNANVSRSQFARIYAAINGLDLSDIQAIQYLYMNDISQGTTGKRTYEDFKPTSNLNRGDMAVFLYRTVQQGSIAIEGLTTSPNGRDNKKITLPLNFVEGKDSTVTVKPTPGTNDNDKEKRPDIYKAVKSINVESEELIANGIDSTLISIELKDSYGNDISFDESLAFKVTSSAGGTFSETNASTSGNSTVVYTDGPQLDVYVTAPALTKSVVDTIRFEMVNPTNQYYTYKNQVIEAKVRYVPKAELRISYEVHDPDQTDWITGDVDPGVKPLPALPQGVVNGVTIPFTQKGIITISDFDEDLKLFSGTKWETYTNPTTGQLTQGEISSEEIQYGNAELKLEGQIISVWLFEQILEYMIYGLEQEENDWGGLGSAKVMYTVNSEGRATYDLQGVMSEEFTAQFDSTVHAAVIYLINILPKADDITLAHKDSVLAIKAIYDKLSQMDKNILQKGFAQAIGKLEGAMSKIEILQKGQELENRPDGMDRYTKVIVNLVLPSGVVITDYRGTVEVSYNGKTKLASFDTNTKDYNDGTGHAGSAVFYFDDVIYGNQKVTARLVDTDPRYDKLLQSIIGTTTSKTIFTNPKFEKNMCSLDAEVSFVVDHSGSMKARDPKNFTSLKVKQTVKQLEADLNYVYRFNKKAIFETSGESETVAKMPSLLQYKSENRGTNVIASVTTAINNFSSNSATKKAVVLITDGKTNRNGIDQMINLAKSKGVAIHTIAVGKYTSVNETLLKQIATETGGTYMNVKEIHDIHSALQSIITSVLCNKVVSNPSCANGDLLFNQTSVVIEKEKVRLMADINTSCDNIKNVRVVFESPSGNKQFDLPYRGSSRFMHRPNLYEFPVLDLYVDVEFQALDSNGNIIASKMHVMNSSSN
ncbi:MAG: VWA domain-containing protein [Solibacillus sp.]|uniref:VWA domain-containing protein n=1 Tax=Solibacillus sp. TaxID=1909654 RepID=UPI003315EBDA